MNYPVNCKKCNQPLYGPVKYCPFCGTASVSVSAAHEKKNLDALRSTSNVPSPELQSKTSPEKVSEDTVKIDSENTVSEEEPAQPEKVGGQKDDGLGPSGSSVSKQSSIAGNKDKDKIKPEAVRLPWKWAAVAILLLIVIIVYFGIRDNGGGSSKPLPPPGGYAPETGGNEKVPPPPPPPPPPPNGKGEAARILALEALRQGTNLSVTICNLPKFEKVLQAAQQLQAISPRYQDQVASAESTISNTRNARDQSLMAYLNKVLELGRYTPAHVSYAMDTIKNGDPAPREKIVAELLAGHVNDLRNNPKPDPVKMLSNFTQRFSDFVD